MVMPPRAVADPAIPFGVVSTDNLLRFTQIATARVVLFTGFLSFLDFDVVSEVEPFQTAARTTHLNIGWVAVVSGYDAVSDEVTELGAESGRSA
jgi:hypothetical protein